MTALLETRSRGSEISRVQRRELTSQLFQRAHALSSEQDLDEALEQVVLINLTVAMAIAWRYRDRGIDLEDLEQTACIGLLMAAQRFDPSHGRDFLTFAVPTISGEVKKHFRDHGWMVRPPRSIQELQPKVERELERIHGAEQGTAVIGEIARRLAVTPGAVVEALGAHGCFVATSLDLPVRWDSPATLGDLVEGVGDRAEEAAEARVMLLPVLRELGERDRRIIRLRFVEELTQREIADILGVTQTQVSRLLAGILMEMRTAMAQTRRRPGA